MKLTHILKNNNDEYSNDNKIINVNNNDKNDHIERIISEYQE